MPVVSLSWQEDRFMQHPVENICTKALLDALSEVEAASHVDDQWYVTMQLGVQDYGIPSLGVTCVSQSRMQCAQWCVQCNIQPA